MRQVKAQGRSKKDSRPLFPPPILTTTATATPYPSESKQRKPSRCRHAEVQIVDEDEVVKRIENDGTIEQLA